ncbi:MAG: A/G-specific adenine glycosylase [Croceitalea sp.]|nr:A/G-specific adenine glycosylase [Croceitalea sp.]
MVFSEKILNWYHQNKRNLPWRNTKDPYKIWLSEIILQQTRVAQGMPYYKKFVKEYPTVEHLAQAKEEQILKLWQGLGYYSRARNMHTTAKMVVNEYDGAFPRTYNKLKQLKGVGDYTASAIASICFDAPEAVVDGNVYRVLSRFFGVALPTNSTEGTKYFKNLAQQVMNTEQIRDYNQGLMEFGALQCTPKNPNCKECPLNYGCMALKENCIGELPLKLNKTKVKKRFFNYMVFLDRQNQTLIEQRTEKGIWQNLFQFPLLESSKNIDELTVRGLLENKSLPSNISSLFKFNTKPIVHKLSHQHLHTTFWVVRLSGPLKKGVQWSKIESYPVPVLIAEFINSFKI